MTRGPASVGRGLAAVGGALAGVGGELASTCGMVADADATRPTDPLGPPGLGEVRGEVAGRRRVNPRHAAAVAVLPLGIFTTGVLAVVDAGTALLDMLAESVVAAAVGAALSLACSVVAWLLSRWRQRRTGGAAWSDVDVDQVDGVVEGDVEDLDLEDRRALAAGGLPSPRPARFVLAGDVVASAGSAGRPTGPAGARRRRRWAHRGDPVRRMVRGVDRTLTGRTIAPADRAAWSSARTLPDLCRLTAAWLAGSLISQPGYYGRVDVDEDLAPGLTRALVACNHAGFLTRSSQAGQGGQHGTGLNQLAAVEGLASPATVRALQEGLAWTPYRVQARPRRRAGSWRHPGVVVTRTSGVGGPVTQFGAHRSRRELASALRGCDRRAIAAAGDAVQVTVWDPVPGRNTLWADLSAALETQPRPAEVSR